MGCFSYNRLSKNFRLSIASSVYSSQSNPSVSMSSFLSLFRRWDLFSLHASTVLRYSGQEVLFPALFCKQEEERFRLLYESRFWISSFSLFVLIDQSVNWAGSRGVSRLHLGRNHFLHFLLPNFHDLVEEGCNDDYCSTFFLLVPHAFWQ